MFSYTFELITQETYWDKIKVLKKQAAGGPSCICHINISVDRDGTGSALIYGKLQGLFGKCPYESEDLENQYTYYVFTENEAGEVIYLYAYSGSSGPAIGGFLDDESRKAAEALVETIQNAEPVDYDYKGCYLDFGSEVKMGIKDGIPYSEESGGIDLSNMDWMNDLPEELQEELRQLGICEE